MSNPVPIIPSYPAPAECALCAVMLLNRCAELLSAASAYPTDVFSVELKTLLRESGAGEFESINATNWPEVRGRVWSKSCSDPEILRLLLLYGSALLQRYPGHLVAWLKSAPSSMFPPAERLELIQIAVDSGVLDRDSEWTRKETGRCLDRVRGGVGPSAWRVPAPPQVAAAEKSPAPAVLTRSQRHALDTLTALASAYFGRAGAQLSVVPRFSALLVAPTGAGKTTLATRLAEASKAHLMVISLGEWIPMGVYRTPPTAWEILSALLRHERIILLADEVDKFVNATDTAWTRCCAAEIWAMFDRRLPVDQYAVENRLTPDLRQRLEDRIRHGLYFVACGTWQAEFTSHCRRSMGFSQSGHAGAASAADVLGKSVIPPELLSRCGAGRPILLEYPDLEETAALLRDSGLVALADEVGRSLRPEDVRWAEMGWRSIETLAADLILERRKHQSADAPTAPEQ